MELVFVFAAVDEGKDLLHERLPLAGLEHDFIDPEDGVQIEHLLLVAVDVLEQQDSSHLKSLQRGCNVALDIPLCLDQEAHNEDFGEQSAQPVEVVLEISGQ